MKQKLTFLVIAILCTLNAIGQNDDVKIGQTYQFNLQRKNDHADAWILHNAKYSKGDNVLKWEQTHSSFGSRGIRFAYGAEKGIYFYADEKTTTGGANFTPTTRFFIGNDGKVGVGYTDPSAKFEVLSKDSHIARFYYYDETTLTCPRLDIWGSTNKINLRTTHNTGGADLSFGTTNAPDALYIKQLGNVGIGTTSPAYKLTVNGTIGAKEIKVTSQIGADFVFEQDYNLMSLAELEQFVKQNKHLPEIAPAQEMQEQGVLQTEMNQKLLQKVEELTLYTIEQQKQLEKQHKLVEEQEQKLKSQQEFNQELLERIQNLEQIKNN